MISEKLSQLESSKDESNNNNNNKVYIPNIHYKTNSFNSIKKDLKLNSNDIINNTQPNQEKVKLCSQKKINLSEDNNNNDSIEHPLVFYALGKVKNPKVNANNIKLYTSQGFRSSSNDMFERNMFSINSSCYDELRKKKGYSTIKQQILEENDYLNPLKIYKSFHKYDVSNNCVNQETYNLAKKKFYSRDRHSNIKKGLYITKKEFNEQKNILLNKKDFKSIDLKEKGKRPEEDSADYKNKTINTDININNNKYIFKDPNDYTKENLKSKEWKFDRNYKIFIKHKNWWKSNRYVNINNNYIILILFLGNLHKQKYQKMLQIGLMLFQSGSMNNLKNI